MMPDDIYLGLYSVGHLEGWCLNSLVRNYHQAFDSDLVVREEMIMRKPVLEANNLMASQFMASGKPYLFHIDIDTELPASGLAAMLNAVKDSADVVTMHSPNRHGAKWKGEYDAGDNHVKDAKGNIAYFAQAVMLCKRRVFELLPYPWWRGNVQVKYQKGDGGEKHQADNSGELYFAQSVLKHPELKHVCIDGLLAPQYEIVTFRGGNGGKFDSSDKPTRGGHVYRRYSKKVELI